MSGNRPFNQHTFIITTPDAVMTFPGLHIRAVAVLMQQQARNNPVLYTKLSGSTAINICEYEHTLEGIEDGRYFHKAAIRSLADLVEDEIHWIDPDRHEITIKPARKMDAPDGTLFTANCSCGAYQSGPMSEKGARLAGNQHAVTKTERERYAV